MNQSERPFICERIGLLRRSFRPFLRRKVVLLPAVALANVLLLMFMFILVTSRFILQPGVVVDLPSSTFVSGTQYESMVVTISQEGMVFFNDERTTLEGLESAFSQTVHEHPEAKLVIEADARVQYGTLIEIYNKAMAAGIKQVALATRISTSGRPIP